MPPYAGLDEIYHVARLVFVRVEGRNPTSREPSIPRYLERSILQEPGQQPAFGVIGERWPDVVASGARITQREVPTAELRGYRLANYEAQHPSLPYSTQGRLLPRSLLRWDLAALRYWRLLSVLFGVVTVLAVGWTGWTVAGERGIVAAALLLSLPTWETLVARAGNDALSCAAIAVAVAMSTSRPTRFGGVVGEGVAWGVALASKLYAWPAALILPLTWYRHEASRRRIVTVLVLGGALLLATVVELGARTENPIGLFAFDRVEPTGAGAVAVRWSEVAKTVVLTFGWTSGQHWNALTPTGLGLFLLPLAALIAPPLARACRSSTGRDALVTALTAAVAFAIAQVVKLGAYLRIANAHGLALPPGGKEGWYWYALAPIFVGLLLATLFAHIRRRSVLVAFVVWLALVDVVLHEGALFRDYRGATTPTVRGDLVRWGDGPAAGRLTAVGPLADHALPLRLAHLAGLGLIVGLVVARDGRGGRSTVRDPERPQVSARAGPDQEGGALGLAAAQPPQLDSRGGDGALDADEGQGGAERRRGARRKPVEACSPDPDPVPELDRRNCLVSPTTTETSSVQAGHEEEPTRPFGIGNG